MSSLRRDDVTTTRTAVWITYFNPRLHEGGDLPVNPESFAFTISILASVKETTVLDNEQLQKLEFQSTPPQRRRPRKEAYIYDYIYFNPRLHEGGDDTDETVDISGIFQSTPPRRRRPIRAVNDSI